MMNSAFSLSIRILPLKSYYKIWVIIFTLLTLTLLPQYLFAISEEKPDGVAQRVYFLYEDPDIAMRSYAAVDAGNCSGTMIGPNVMMTAAHCGTHDRTIRFRVYTDEEIQGGETFSCKNMIHTFPDMDLNLYWCQANASGENPGDKYGYVDFDIVIDPDLNSIHYTASRNLLQKKTGIYSIWMNGIDSIGGGIHSIYSEGTITDPNGDGHWGSPNKEIGDDFRCDNTDRPAENVAVVTNLWSNGGASGSSHLSKDTNRLLIGPLSVGTADGRYRDSISMIDHLYWGFTDPSITCSTCCAPDIADQVNRTLLTDMGIADPQSFYGYVDKNMDGIFDVQHALESLMGENTKEWYWLGFESLRRNALWTKTIPEGVNFDIPHQDVGILSLSTSEKSDNGFIPVLTHKKLNLKAGRYYHLSFSAIATNAPSTTPIRVCLEGSENHCEVFDRPPSDRYQEYSAKLWASNNADLSFQLERNTTVRLTHPILNVEDAVMDFDSHDQRAMWINANNSQRALILPTSGDSKQGESQIENRKWKKCLNLQSHHSFDGGSPNIWNCAHHVDQTWSLEQYDDGSFGIKNPHHDMCLAIDKEESHSGGHPEVRPCADDSDQKWELNKVNDKSYTLVNQSWNKCLKLEAEQNHNGGHLTVSECDSSPDRQWSLIGEPNWAGVVYRDPSQAMDNDWPLKIIHFGATRQDRHRICFNHRLSSRFPLTGDAKAVFRRNNNTGISYFSPGNTWQQYCTPWLMSSDGNNSLQFGIEAMDDGVSGAYIVDNILVERYNPDDGSSVPDDGSSVPDGEPGDPNGGSTDQPTTDTGPSTPSSDGGAGSVGGSGGGGCFVLSIT